MRRLPARLTLVFDGSCAFCTWSVLVATRLDRHHRITPVPFQAAARLAPLGVTVAEAEGAAWAVTPRGARYRGAAAVALTLAVALGTRAPMWLYLIPGIRQAADAIYAAVARHRRRFPGVTPYCQQYPAACR